MLKIPTPRLLPATIATLAALLLLKCGVLVQAAVTNGSRPDGVMVAAANAASTEQVSDHAKTPVAGTPPAQQNPAAAVSPAPEGPPPVSDSERALLQDLRQRRKELDLRADAVTTRESVLVAAEQKLRARLMELQTLQKKLEGLDTAQKQKEEAGWQGLVKVYETMKPKEAAVIFNDLSMPVLLQVLDRMKDAKAAVIMATMNPDRARDVPTGLVQLRTSRNTDQLSPAASASNPSGR